MNFATTVGLLRVTVTGQDRYGKDILTTSETPSPGWALWPQGSDESIQGQDITSDSLNALAPVGVDVSSVDRVRVLGRVYEVTGHAYGWVSPLTGSGVGAQMQLKAVTG